MNTVRHANALALLLGLSLLTSCTTPSPAAKRPPFTEEESADFIVRYYSEQTSYLLKPLLMEGSYRTICDRASVLKLAQQQPRHELAVIVLIHYPSASIEEPVKLAWLNDLKRVGYRRIVFLRARSSMQVNGSPILESPQAPVAVAGK